METIDNKRRILILGSFDDGNNIGDVAIISSLISDFKEELDNVEFVVPVKRRNALRTYPVKTIWSRILFFDPITVSAVFRSDILLITQANIFDARIFNVTFNRLFGYFYLFTLAKLLGKKIAFYNTGLGPVNTKLGQRIAKYLTSKADVISLREVQSITYLEKWQIDKKPFVAADPALNTKLVEPSAQGKLLKAESIDRNQVNIAFNLTRYVEKTFGSNEIGLPAEKFIKIISGVADQLVNTFNASIYFIVTSKGDTKLTEAVLKKMKHALQGHLIIPLLKYTPEEFTSILAAMDVVVGSRMHSLILAVAAGTPVIGLVYAPKTRNFMVNIGQSQRIIELQKLNADLLFNMIEETYKQKAEIVEEVTLTIAPLKVMARHSAKLVADLIR